MDARLWFSIVALGFSFGPTAVVQERLPNRVPPDETATSTEDAIRYSASNRSAASLTPTRPTQRLLSRCGLTREASTP